MSNKTYRLVLWSSVLGTLALVILGMVWLAKGGGQPQVYVPGVNEILADDHSYGPENAKVTVVDYSDFQCSACAVAYPTIEQLMQDYGDRVRFVYRNLPIPGHMNGVSAAYAAGAAGNQGKFFEMAGLIFAKQNEWSVLNAAALSAVFDSYARELGLDLDKFRADQSSYSVKAKVEKDAESGVKAGVDATPTFFINGVRTNARTYDEFKSQLDAALGS